MAVAFDAATPSTAIGIVVPNPYTFTHTPVGTPTAFVLSIVNWDGGATLGTVSYGGVTMTSPVTAAIDGTHNLYIYSLASPPTGTQTVSIGYAGTMFASFGAMTFTGSDPATVFRATNTATGTGLSASVNVAGVVSGDLVVDAVGNVNSATFTAAGPQTERVSNVASGNNILSDSTKSASGTVTMSWTLSGSQQWAQVAGAIQTAAGVAVVTSVIIGLASAEW